MLLLKGVSAWIEVDGKELEEHGVEEDLDQNKVTCWIATQVGKGFSVAFRDNTPYRDHSLFSSLQLDGSSIRGKVLYPTTEVLPNIISGRTVYQDDQVLSVTSSRPFRYSKLELTDEDEYLDQASTSLGEIRIHIYRGQVLETQLLESRSEVPSHGKVHERSKKAVTQCVSYGEEIKTGTQYICHMRHLDGNAPFTTFIFKYRDFSLLQANCIIPKPPPTRKGSIIFEGVVNLTTGEGVKPDPDGEEIEIIDSATRKKVVRLSGRSNASGEREGRPAKRIKREQNFVPTGEVIDLT